MEKTTNYTPGPWMATPSCAKPGKWGIYGNDTGSTVQLVGHVEGTEQAEANVRLIAAAPDLLEALTFLVQAADTEPGMAIYKAHIDKARAAIARAEGQ
jgi:hypothetical protein